MPERRSRHAVRLILGTLVLAASAALASSRGQPSDAPRRLDPSAWGGDHVGQPVPDYATGDECLFCHRGRVGATWGANRHSLTIRERDPQSPALAALKQSPARALVDEVRYVLGDGRRQRFLKPAAAYGQVEMLSVEWSPPRDKEPGQLLSADRPHWDADRFGLACAGCHATAVDPKERAFSVLSLDCYVCHGNVPDEHANRPELAHLSPRRKDPARVVTSICAQCHVRTGRSKSTGRPYANNFVAGDNLFRDFQVDLSDPAFRDPGAADRHVLENVRDVVLLGKETVTCLSCHDVHGRSSRKHHLVPRGAACLTCHHADGPKRVLKPFSAHSKTCGY